MRRAVLALTAAAVLWGAAPAGAQVGIRASDGWLSWTDGGNDRVLERRGKRYPSPKAFITDLGTDALGRPVATYVVCSHTPTRAIRGCAIHERLLGARRSRTLVPERKGFVVEAVAQHRGTLAVGQNRGRAGRASWILLRRPGRRDFTVVARRRRAVRIDLEDGLLSFRQFGDRDYVRTIDLRGSRPRERMIAANDTRDFDCKCEQVSIQILDATLDGRHVYWLETTVESTDGSSIGTGSHNAVFSARFLRADALAARPAVEEYRVLDRASARERWPSSFAVDRGVLYHDGRENFRRGVRPKWRRTGERLPIEN